MTELKLYSSKKKIFGFLIISLLLTSADIFIICNGNNNWKAWLGLVLFSGCSIALLYRMLSDKCELTIDENGVYGKSTSNKTIRWEIMKDAYLHKVNNQIFICLVLHEKESIYKDESDFKKDMMEFNKIFFGIQEVNLNIGLLNCDKNKILGLLLLLIHFENDKRSKVINDYLMEL